MKLKWPFVSRRAYELLERQLATSEAERQMLLDRQLNGPPQKHEEKPAMATVVEPTQPASTADSKTCANPLDRVLLRFDEARQKGTTIPAQFRVKA